MDLDAKVNLEFDLIHFLKELKNVLKEHLVSDHKMRIDSKSKDMLEWFEIDLLLLPLKDLMIDKMIWID